MPLIKSTSAPSGVIPFSMRDIETHARLIIQKAQQQAEALLAAAMVEAEQLKAGAQDEGFTAGRADGMARGLDEGKLLGQQQSLDKHGDQLSALIGSLSLASAEVDAQRHALESDADAAVIRLAAAIARKVVKKTGIADNAVLTTTLGEALRLVVSSSDVRIAIHPSQKQTLDDALPAIKLQWPQLQHVELIADATLAPGGCRIFTRQGLIDADLDGQVDRILAELIPDQNRPEGIA